MTPFVGSELLFAYWSSMSRVWQNWQNWQNWQAARWRQAALAPRIPCAPFGQEFFLEPHNTDWLRSPSARFVAPLLGQPQEIRKEHPAVAPSQPVASLSSLQTPMSWLKTDRDGITHVRLVYHGPLAGPDLRLHYGFDGWQEPIAEVKLEEIEPGLVVTEPLALDGRLTLDCAVTDGTHWDNNREIDYRLWIGFEPFDAHMHVSGRGSGDLGLRSLHTAMASAGIGSGLVSWIDNTALDRIDWQHTRLAPLVWVRPGDTELDEVRERLAAGYVGLKLHPTMDDYQADDHELDPYLEIAAAFGCPVTCHSAPGEADPDHIRRLAERFPIVPIVLYHTYLGPSEGRRRAAQHVREQPNLSLETSWCGWREVLQLVEEVGPERVMFGSDASVDGAHHYCRHPPNVEGHETYNEGLIPLVRALGPEAARKVLGDNARRLFGL